MNKWAKDVNIAISRASERQNIESLNGFEVIIPKQREPELSIHYDLQKDLQAWDKENAF